MKKIYNKTFDYYNSDQTVNARVTLSIELDKNIIKETVSLYKILEEAKNWDKIEHFEKMYSKKEWIHGFTKELLLGIDNDDMSLYFEKYALSFGDSIIRKSVLKLVKPEYKYDIQYISTERFTQGVYCHKAINGDNDVLAFDNGLGKFSFSTIVSKNPNLQFPLDDSLSFIIPYNDYNVLFEMRYVDDTENRSINIMIHPADIYYEIYLLKKDKIYSKDGVLLGSTLKAGNYINLMINNPDMFYNDFLNQLKMYKSILDTPANRNPLFSSNFKRKSESDIMKNPACMFSITSKTISFDSYNIDPENSQFAVRRPTTLALSFATIVDMFTLDDEEVLKINYANRHIQYIIDTFPNDANSTRIQDVKSALTKWRFVNNPIAYMGCGI